MDAPLFDERTFTSRVISVDAYPLLEIKPTICYGRETNVRKNDVWESVIWEKDIVPRLQHGKSATLYLCHL